jgi:DNA processing protein
MPQLSERERLAWIRLARTPNIGPVTFANLLARCGSASAALEAAPRLARRGGGTIKLADEDAVRREIDALARAGGRMIVSCEPDFPLGLAALEAPPPVISMLGHAKLMHREMIAMVGARNASALGRKLAERLAADLGKAGLAVVSGLARGIDCAAHEGALATGTLAVIAGGVDVVYPPENATLYQRIRSEGAIVSEMPLGMAPVAKHFPRRNRIISGLARGVIVVEAAEGSGSLITARFALEQNREIFAVPGSPLDPRAKGTNRLVREGATLTETADDVLAVLAPILSGSFNEPARDNALTPPEEWPEEEMAHLRRKIEEALGPAAVSVDELIRLSGAPTGAVLTIMLELELAGRLARHPGNKVSWR